MSLASVIAGPTALPPGLHGNRPHKVYNASDAQAVKVTTTDPVLVLENPFGDEDQAIFTREDIINKFNAEYLELFISKSATQGVSGCTFC